MALSRSWRRRRSTLMLVGGIVTLLVLIFARDVSRAAHNDHAANVSENKSFAVLANIVITQENGIGALIAHDLSVAPRLSRAQLWADITTVHAEANSLRAQAAVLTGPTLVDNLAPVFVHVALSRARAYDAIVSQMANELQLPDKRTNVSLTSAEVTLDTSAHTWATLVARSQQHGAANLIYFTQTNGGAQASAIAALGGDANLQVRRGVSIAALNIAPVPFPSVAGVIEIVPSTSLGVSVSVVNAGVVAQPVTVTVTLQRASGRVEVHAARGTIAASGALAFGPMNFPIAPGEHDTMSLVVSGAPAVHGNTDRTYHVVVAPS